MRHLLFLFSSLILALVADGCSSDDQNPTMALPQPYAEFAWSGDTSFIPTQISFRNLSLYANHYIWNFGDRQTVEAFEPMHRFGGAKTYEVSLIAFNSLTQTSDTAKQLITITSPAPISNFSWIGEQAVGLNIHFTNNSSYSNSYIWNFGDSTSSNLMNPNHIFSQSGEYLIILTSLDSCTGLSNTSSQIIDIDDPDVLAATWGSIRDLVAIRCAPCHTTQSQNGFNVTSHANIMANGDIIAGDADGSFMIKKLLGDPQAGARMPQGGPYLSTSEIDTIKVWINAGAQDN